MSKMVELKLYSPLQVDVIDQDRSDHAVPLQAVNGELAGEYLGRIMNSFREIQPQEDARNAFIAPEQDWSEVCEKIVSLTRAVEAVNGTLHGVYTCRSRGELNQEESESVKWHCRDQWEQGWGEGYAHCTADGSGLGLYIHYWQDAEAPLLIREELEAALDAQRSAPAIAKIDKDTFWTLIDQAKTDCGSGQRAAAYWLRERLLAMNPEQALRFHCILHGYMELADKYGLWNAAILMSGGGCSAMKFEDFRAWLIAQGRDTYLAALRDPDCLVSVSDNRGGWQFTSLPYVGDMAHYRLTGRMAHVDVKPEEQRRLVAELRQDIVYSTGIEYPHEWSEVAAYLPRLTAQHLTPEELRACICRGHMWNHDDPAIQQARAVTPKKKKTRSGKKKGGESR